MMSKEWQQHYKCKKWLLCIHFLPPLTSDTGLIFKIMTVVLDHSKNVCSRGVVGSVLLMIAENV